MTDKKNNFAKDINVPRKEQTNDSLKNQDKNFNEKFTQEKEQILLKDINETGFYCAVDDTERLYLYEVINNTNKEWLKKDSQAKLLIDEWIYDYTDYDDRKVYFTSGNLEATYNNISTGKVYKIEDTKFKIYGKCGQFLVEDKLTYKEQLARKTAECELLETQLESYYIGEAKLVQRNQELEQECEQIKEKYEALKLENEEGYEIADELKQECEELKKQLETSEKWRIKAESLNENFELKNTCYRKALEEIETATKINCEEICGRKFTDCKDTSCFSVNILDIISRAKGEE